MSSDGALASGPYRGLRPFGDSAMDALLFFGRERERAILVANLRAARLTVLYGPSGAGKTSLVRAGVVHELRTLAERDARAGRVVVYERWAGDPRAGLASAIEEACGGLGPAAGLADLAATASERVGGPLYLVLDQFEEYFTYHAAETLAAELPELVGRPGLDVHVLISLRDDSLSRLDVFKDAIPTLFANVLRLDRLDRQGARRAIVGPLERYGEVAGEGLSIEPELVERVLDEVAVGRLESSEASATPTTSDDGRIEAPYLQLVLERLWNEEQRDGSTRLRLETLRRLGGAEAIVRDHLDSALASLDDRQLDAAAAVLNQLVTPSGTKIAHRPADLAEYAQVAAAELAPVLAALGRERILRTIEASGSEPERCEIFHDVLAGPIHSWRSSWAVERERRAARRQRRRLLLLSGAAFAALAVVVAVAIFALVQRSHARADTRRAQARELATSALVELPTNGQAALALALRAARLSQSEQSEDVLRTALVGSHERAVIRLGGSVQVAAFDRSGTHVLAASTNGRVELLDPQGRVLWARRTAEPLVGAFFTPDGRSVVAAGGSGVWTWDVGSGRELRGLRLPAPVSSVGVARLPESSAGLLLVGQPRAIDLVPLVPGQKQRALATAGTPVVLRGSRDGRLLAAIVRDAEGVERAVLYELRQGRLLKTLPGKGVKAIAFSPGSRLLATGSSDRSARIWNSRSGRLLRVLPHKGWVVSLAFSPDGRELATASKDGGTRVWDVSTGVRLLIFVGPIGSINSVDYSSSGRFVLAGSSDRTVRVDDTGGPEEGRELGVLTGNRDAVMTASFSPNEQLAVTGGSDGTARIWDPGVAEQLRSIDAEPVPVRRVAFSPDGRKLLIVRDSGLHVRSADTKALTESLDTKRKLVAASFSPGSRFLAAESADGLVQVLRGGKVVLRLQASGTGMAFAGDERLMTAGPRGADLWAVPSGRHLRSLPADKEVLAVAATRDGSTGATLDRDGDVELWNLDGGQRLGRLSRPAVRIVFSPDGRLLLTSSGKDGYLWRVDDLELLHVLRGHTADLTAAAFGAGGTLVLTGSFDHDARVWSVRDGRTIAVLRGHFFPIYAVDSTPDGRWVLTAGQLTAGVWRTSSGQPLFFLRGPQETISDVSFGADGRTILVGSQDGHAYLYRCEVCGDLDALKALAEQRLRGAPTTAQEPA